MPMEVELESIDRVLMLGGVIILVQFWKDAFLYFEEKKS